jgi:Fic-DOC domain mobile mystery protein B
VTPSDADEFATPLAAEECEGLLPQHVTLRCELNELEAANILAAALWAFRCRRGTLLSEQFLLQLHKRMFGLVWSWAGTYRRTPRNVGIEAWRIRSDVKILLGDAEYWVKNATYEPHECAVRFHHRLVSIHPFANGNGRHSRLMADLIAKELRVQRLSWGGNGVHAVSGDLRGRYITALQSADNHDYEPLIAFATY